MDQKMTNPLNKYFRQPAIYMELPSQGKWWKPGSLDLGPDQRVPICPMTAKDEILLRTPDALLNGITVAEVFKSCCNVIKDGWAVPAIDVDALLIGIRIASYGNILDVDTKCPHCGEQNRHGIDLGERLSNIKSPNFDKTLQLGAMLIKFKPMSYFAINRENTVSFYEEKIKQSVYAADISDDEKIRIITEEAKKMLDASLLSLAHQTEFIQMEDGIKVIEFEFIQEFYNNIDGDSIRAINDHIKSLYTQVQPPDFAVSCQGCTKNYSFPFEFDYTNFFVRGF